MASKDGKDRVLATAQHIMRSLGTDETITEDMLRIFCNFDDRFSSMNYERLRRGNTDRNIDRDRNAPAPCTIPCSPPAEEPLHKSLQLAGETVVKWEMAASSSCKKTRIWDLHCKDSASAYLLAVDELQDLMGSLSLSRHDRPAFDRAQSLLQLAMSRLEEEFRHLLVSYSHRIDPEWILEVATAPPSRGEDDSADTVSRSSIEEEEENRDDDSTPSTQFGNGFNVTVDLLPSEVVSDLNDIARRMMAGGYGRECCQIYASFRKAVLDQCLYRLGVEKLTIEDVHKMAWENLEVRIKKWVQTLKVAVRVLYASERLLCDQVFDGLSPWRETAFADLAKGSMIQLLSLGESIAISRRSPEKLFKVLDMYETLWDLLPDINVVFSDDLCSNIRSEANGILVRLGEAARGTFAEFENAIQRDASKTPVPGGAVHPLTRYVMNYIWLLFCYTGTLKRLLGDKKLATPRIGGRTSWNFSSGEDTQTGADHLSPLAVQIIWLTVLLECNLDGKSKLYKDVALSYLFLMNNAHYIVQKVKQSELASLIGEDWVRKHSGQVRQYAINYVRAAWNKVLACLRDEGLSVSGSFSSGISKVALKERFKSFNTAFEEVHRIQSTWVVPDAQLREELRLSIAEKLIPAYRAFMSRFQSYLEAGRHPGKYLKYSPEDLDSRLLDLFEGPSGQVVPQRRSFSIT